MVFLVFIFPQRRSISVVFHPYPNLDPISYPILNPNPKRIKWILDRKSKFLKLIINKNEKGAEADWRGARLPPPLVKNVVDVTR